MKPSEEVVVPAYEESDEEIINSEDLPEDDRSDSDSEEAISGSEEKKEIPEFTNLEEIEVEFDEKEVKKIEEDMKDDEIDDTDSGETILESEEEPTFIETEEGEELSGEDLIKKIQAAFISGESSSIKDVLLDVLKKENKGGVSGDFKDENEIKEYLQKTLTELKEKINKEEKAEAGVVVGKPEKKGKAKEMTEEERKEFEGKENEAHEKAMADKEMLYTTKINLMEDDANEDTKEIKEELLRTVEYVNKEKVKENCATEIKELIKLSYKEAQKGEGEEKTEYENKIGELAETMNLSPEEIQAIVTTQRANFEELAYQHSKQKESKKESKWKKIGKALGKIAIYGVGGVALGVLTGGLAAGIGMALLGSPKPSLRARKTVKLEKRLLPNQRECF